MSTPILPSFVLATRSPRRIQMLEAQGYSFVVQAADIDETPRPHEAANAFVLRMAAEKAEATARMLDNGLPVLAADTDVALGDRILGKPESEAHEVEMLLQLSGRAHQVHSAVALRHAGGCEVIHCVTEVYFGLISEAEARAYWHSGEPQGKSGGYAVQGLASRWIAEVRGSYTSVVGLPLYEACNLLQEHGIVPGPYRV